MTIRKKRCIFVLSIHNNQNPNIMATANNNPAAVVEQMFIEALTQHQNSDSKYYYHQALAIEAVLKTAFGYTDSQISELNSKAIEAANK